MESNSEYDDEIKNLIEERCKSILKVLEKSCDKNRPENFTMILNVLIICIVFHIKKNVSERLQAKLILFITKTLTDNFFAFEEDIK